MKECFKCNAVKPLTAFYKHKNTKDKVEPSCKKCRQDRVRFNRINFPERFIKTEQKRKNKRASEKRYKGFLINKPYMIYAHRRLNYAVSAGWLKRMPCMICGVEKSHAHHEDYNFPLDVVWLCGFHHKERHAKIILNEDEKRYYDK